MQIVGQPILAAAAFQAALRSRDTLVSARANGSSGFKCATPLGAADRDFEDFTSLKKPPKRRLVASMLASSSHMKRAREL